MTKINPYIHYSGNCREAMTFYRDCIGGELKLMTNAESPMAKEMPADKQDQIMHASLTSGGFTLMGSDMGMPDNTGVIKGDEITLAIICDTLKELKIIYDKLSKGGKKDKLPEAAFFGTYGELTDKFGMEWMLQSDEK